MRQKQTLNGCSGSRRNTKRAQNAFPLHRVGEVMARESVSIRSLAGRLNITQGEASRLIDPENDMNLSELYQLAEVLRVPLSEMVSDVDVELSEPVKLRAQLLRLMRTVNSIQETSTQMQVLRLARQLRQDLLKIMPELKEVTSWPLVGNPRSRKELGAIVDRCIPSNLFPTSQGEPIE